MRNTLTPNPVTLCCERTTYRLPGHQLAGRSETEQTRWPCRSPDPETETLPCQVSEFRQECPWAGDSLLGRQPAQGTKRGSRDAGQPPKGRLPFLLPPAAEPRLGTLSQPSSRGGLSPGAEGGCKEAGGGDGGGRARGGADEWAEDRPPRGGPAEACTQPSSPAASPLQTPNTSAVPSDTASQFFISFFPDKIC